MVLDPRQTLILTFGLSLVEEIEKLGFTFIRVEDFASLRKSQIDRALVRNTPVFGGIADEMTRLAALDRTIAQLLDPDPVVSRAASDALLEIAKKARSPKG